MNSGSYGHTYHGLSVESMLFGLSSGSGAQSEVEADVLPSHTILDRQAFYPSLFVEDKARMSPGPLAIPPDVGNPHVNVNIYANYTSMQPTFFHGRGTPYSGTRDPCLPEVPVMGPSSSGGTPYPGHSITQSQGGLERAESSVGATRTFSQIYGNSFSHSEWIATPLAGSATGIQYTHADDTPNDSVSSAVPPDPCMPITAQYQQRTQHDQPRKVQKKKKGIPATPSQSSQRPAGIQGALSKLKYSCDVPGCGKPFKQSQSRDRHKREVHHVGVEAYHDWHCVRCHKSWPSGRGHKWKGHLMKEHPDVDADEEYKKAKKNRRGFDPQAQISPPIHEHDRRIRAEPQVHPPTPPLPVTTMAKPPLVSPSTFLQVDYDMQPASPGLTIMGREHDDARQSESLNASPAGTPSFTEERSQMVKDLDAYNYTYAPIWHTNSQDGRIAVNPSSTLIGLIARSSLMAAHDPSC